MTARPDTPADLKPQHFEWVESSAMGPYLTDDAWVAEQKLDGMRCMVRCSSNGTVRFFTSGGRELVQAAAALHFPQLIVELAPLAAPDPEAEVEVVLDGELIPSTGTYWVFDILWTPAGSMTQLPFYVRRSVLDSLFGGWSQERRPHVRVVPQAVSTEEKQALAVACYDGGQEGLVLKRVDAPYAWTGDRVATTLKAKFKTTADLVVTARNVGEGLNVKGEMTQTCNAHLAAYDEDGTLVHVGACSMIGKPDARVGDVVEVEYLYFTGTNVYQPTLLRIRDDKLPTECLVTQFRHVSREVVTL